MPEAPSPADAMYPGGPKTDLGNGEPAPMMPETRTLLKSIMETGMKGLGFNGGALGMVDDLVKAFDHTKAMSPLQRLHEFRQSPDYRGPKPAGASKEETEQLRGRQ